MDGDEASIHYSIAPGERGKGYGKLLIEMASAELHKTHPEIKKILAGVKPDNPASQKCFTSNGYEEKYIIYELNL
jgi:RimJ/RimL family protein N-acetyltransferase